jgi:50S ribosomal protein L16 3-hydroxylase
MTQRPAPAIRHRITEPPGGWENFVAADWRRRPHHFKAPFPRPFASGDEMFRLLVETGDSARDTLTTQARPRASARFYVEHGRIASGTAKYLPRSEDGSLGGYVGRINDLLGGRDFTLIVNDAQASDFELWDRMRGFVSGLYDIVGMPLRSEVVIYTSRSRVTASGVHKDTYDNFLFQVCGRKRFRLWPTEVLSSRPHLIRATDYQEILGEATTVDLDPGDLLYIPADFYHLAEADEELSIHVSIIVGADPDFGHQLVTGLAAQAVRARLGGAGFDPLLPINPTEPDASGRAIPNSLAKIIEALDGIGEDVREPVIEELTRLSTAFGCKLSPPPLETPARFNDDDLVEMNPDSAVSYRVSQDKLYLASNGQGFSCPAHPNAVGLIRHLIEGRQSRVGEILNAYSGTAAVAGFEVELRADDLRNLLETLYQIRFIRRANA